MAAEWEPVAAVEFDLELCWHFGFVRELVVNLSNGTETNGHDRLLKILHPIECHSLRATTYLDWRQRPTATWLHFVQHWH